MTGEEAMLKVVEGLEAAGISYMLTGSFASNHYGIPRSTQDADFVIQLGDQPISVLLNHLGPEFKLDPQITFETVTATKRYALEVASAAFKIELFLLSDDAHDQERFQRRQVAEVFDRRVFLPTVEDVIVSKLQWSLQGQRNKDRDDIRDVIAVQGERIDWDYVHSWCDRQGTRGTLDAIRGEIPPIQEP